MHRMRREQLQLWRCRHHCCRLKRLRRQLQQAQQSCLKSHL